MIEYLLALRGGDKMKIASAESVLPAVSITKVG